MSKYETEARLLKALAVEIEELETLEKFRLGEVCPDGATLLGSVQLLFNTPYVHNPAPVRERMEKAFASMIAENAKELVANAVAVQRGIVEAKRQELADFQSGRNIIRNSGNGNGAPPPPSSRPPADEGDEPGEDGADASAAGDPLRGQRMDSADVGEEADLDF